jgi:predicted nucleic acid-binding protein
MPAPIAAELDYMLTARRGHQGNAAFLRDLAGGRFEVANLEPADYATIHALNERYSDLGASLADLSIVVVAARYRTTRLLTFDGHFRALQPLLGKTYTILPDDEPTERRR